MLFRSLKYLQVFGVPRLEALQLLRHCKLRTHKVSDILIRRLQHKKTYPQVPPLTDPILYFANFYQAALYWFQEKVLSFDQLPAMTYAFHRYYGLHTVDLVAYLEALLARCSDSEKQLVQDLIQSLGAPDLLYRESKGVHLLDKPDLTEFDRLDEETILKLAQEWRKGRR